LRAVIAVPSSSDPIVALDDLGYGAAKYLVDREIHRSRIGVSCGNTTRLVARAFGTRFRVGQLPRLCEVFPLNAVHESFREIPNSSDPVSSFVTSTVHPNTIVGSMLSALPHASGTSFVLTERTDTRVRETLNGLTGLDHYIVGIGAIDFEGKKRMAASTL